jgi:hypothetical protein
MRAVKLLRNAQSVIMPEATLKFGAKTIKQNGRRVEV